MTSSDRPKASVVILTKNGGALLRRVLKAVRVQQTPWPFDVLVIDSGSSDGTPANVKGLGVRLKEISPEEFGHGKTRNLGASLTRGEWIVFITQDALPMDDHWLENLVAAAESAPGVAGAFGRHIAYPGASAFAQRELQSHFDGFLKGPKVAGNDDQERYRKDPKYRRHLHFFSNNNSCIRRSVWESHPFPEVDFAEDQIWARTVVEAGYRKAYADNAIVYHSHDFGAVEQCRRSFDESRAFKQSFNYDLSPGIFHMVAKSLLTTWLDWRYAYKKGILFSDFSRVMQSPLLNFARQFGTYLGQRHRSLPAFIVERISRDRSLQKER